METRVILRRVFRSPITNSHKLKIGFLLGKRWRPEASRKKNLHVTLNLSIDYFVLRAITTVCLVIGLEFMHEDRATFVYFVRNLLAITFSFQSCIDIAAIDYCFCCNIFVG